MTVQSQNGAGAPYPAPAAVDISVYSSLGGQFFTDDNLIAAASVFVALPTLIVYVVLQRYFIAGLTIGAEKG